MCICICIYIYTYTHIHIYIYIYIYDDPKFNTEPLIKALLELCHANLGSCDMDSDRASQTLLKKTNNNREDIKPCGLAILVC